MSALRIGGMAAALRDRIRAATTPGDLDELSGEVSGYWGKGKLTDAEATWLGEAIELGRKSATVTATRRVIKQKRRFAEWHGRAYKTAEELRARFKGDAEKIEAALQEELERGPDFLQYRRGDFGRPPRNNLDRNYIARIFFVAQMIERKSWACRKKGKHGGTLGTVAIEVLRVLLFVVKKHGGELYPSYETLAVLCRKSRQAVITAIKVLERMGFITVHRRIKRINTPFGLRVVQDSNAYQFHLPVKGLGALAMAVFCPASESTKSAARKPEDTQGEENSRDQVRGEGERGLPRKDVDRWWLHDPLPMGNGSFR
jgi:hypothetical protein